jgi:hypothetical protein
MTRLFLSTCGSIAFHVLAAYLSGLLVVAGTPNGYFATGAELGLVVWSTRPRATFAVFLVNAVFAFWDLHTQKKQRERIMDEATKRVQFVDRQYHHNPFSMDFVHQDRREAAVASVPAEPAPYNIFLKTCVTAFLTEAHVNLVGVPLWFSFGFQADSIEFYKEQAYGQPEGKTRCAIDMYASAYKNGETKKPTCSYATNKRIDIAKMGITVSTIGFTAFVLLPVWVLAVRRCCGSTSLGGLFKWMLFCWAFATGTFAFSFMLWQAILNGTADEDFCIISVKKLDAIYIALPFVLAMWRQIV